MFSVKTKTTYNSNAHSKALWLLIHTFRALRIMKFCIKRLDKNDSKQTEIRAYVLMFI
jgi:hypothetical protein